jgi:hypothetical protein
MSDDLIYVEPRQKAVLRLCDAALICANVPEAWLAWAQLAPADKERATIEVGEESYNAWAIKRLRYHSAARAVQGRI